MIWSIELLVLQSIVAAVFCVGKISAFSSGETKKLISQGRSYYHHPQQSTFTHLSAKHNENEAGDLVHLEVIATSGLSSHEISVVIPEIVSSVDDHFGMKVISGDNGITKDIIHIDNNPVSESIPGATGRVILLSLNNVAQDWSESDERIEPFKNLISQHIDSLVGSQIEQPILIAIKPNLDLKVRNESQINVVIRQIVEHEVAMYDLRTPIGSSGAANREREDIFPATHIEIDGAYITDPVSGKELWDTSSILVFDDFVDHSLRERLLDVVNQRGKGYDWDDKSMGPDPSRWTKGGLVDIFDESEDTSSSWGLAEDATYDLCYNTHEAILEVEEKIGDYFHDYIVTRLPEAVLGSCVSPLTANAPTFGDSFSYHIDADPNQTPPSPWTDIYGRYFNRVRGKPRFVSCLMYLNDEWNEKWGAPTEFYDPPTGEIHQVFPRPGRVVMMDQDITHTVVPPNDAAGELPRYSLVFKLIIHPRKPRQCVRLPVGDSQNSIQIGSAQN